MIEENKMADTDVGTPDKENTDSGQANIAISRAEWEMMLTQNKTIMKELSRRSKRKRTQSDTDEDQHDQHEVDQDILSYEENYSHEYDEEGQYFSEEDKRASDSEREFRQSTTKKKKVEDKLANLCTKVKEKNSKQHEKPDLSFVKKQYKKEEETGPKIDEDLADVFNTMAQGEMEDEMLEEKMAKHKRPENCEYFTPRVNSELWSCMDHTAKSDDLRTQKRQAVVTTAVNIVVNLAQKCMVGDEMSTQDLFSGLTDTAGLLLKVVHDMSLDRRRKIVNSSSVDVKYKKLASAEVPVTKQLFGDDLKTACNQIDTSNKLGNAFTQSVRGRKFFPMKGKNWQPRGRGDLSWRGQARGRQSRGRFPYRRGQGRRPGYGRPAE